VIRAVAVLALAGCAARTTPQPVAHDAAIDAIAERALTEGGATGLSIVVMRGDRVVHARGYGLADAERHVAATEQSVYLLASLSKQFWAVGVMQLVEQNRLSVESSIVDVLYKFPDRRVLVKHVLSQTSGLGDDSDDEDDIAFADHPAPAFEPGSWWMYSNRGATLARRLLEQVTGIPWSRYLAEHIAKPLGLTSVTICPSAPEPPMYRADKQRVTETVKTMERVQFVCANALDVARFERSLDTGALLRADSVAKMRAPTEIAGMPLPYGWLTRIADLDGHRAYGHTGSGEGASVAAFRFPADDLTIVVLINSAPRPGHRAWSLVAHIARAELHLPEPALADHAVAQDELAAIAGTYANGPAHAVIAGRDGHAYLTFSVDGKQVWDGPLVALGPRAFAGGPGGDPDPDYAATFLPATGQATAIAIGHRFLLDNVFRRE